ncbi:hypothetical protein HK101_000619 [Irineochytrium annulatum]|nr:hypothetical protein HK101_000619 [Irineochytrium annulatum]
MVEESKIKKEEEAETDVEDVQPTPGSQDVLERGHIYFFYKPRVQEDHPESIDDLQRFYILLLPTEGPSSGKDMHRLILVAKKRLPSIAKGHERFFAFVDAVGSLDDSLEHLRLKTYQTKTRGERTQHEARPCGAGVYAIVREKKSTHLCYVLRVPENPGPVQDELKIHQEGSYVLSVKNPESSTPRNVGLSPKSKPAYPAELKSLFGSRRFISAEPGFLDHAHCELLLIAARADELNAEEKMSGIEDWEEEEWEEIATLKDKKKLFKMLELPVNEFSSDPLLKGVWA